MFTNTRKSFGNPRLLGQLILLTALLFVSASASAQYISDADGEGTGWTTSTSGYGTLDTYPSTYFVVMKEGGAGSGFCYCDIGGSEPSDALEVAVHGQFKFVVSTYYWDEVNHQDTGTSMPAIGVNGEDILHIARNSDNTNWVKIWLPRPGYTADQQTYQNYLVVETSCGAQFRSKNKYNFRNGAYHTVDYYIYVKHDQWPDPTKDDTLKIRLKIDGNEEGMLSWKDDDLNTLDIDDWTQFWYGLEAAYGNDVDYKLKDFHYDDASYDPTTGDFLLTWPTVNSGHTFSKGTANDAFHEDDTDVSYKSGGVAGRVGMPQIDGETPPNEFGDYVIGYKPEEGGTGLVRRAMNITTSSFYQRSTFRFLTSAIEFDWDYTIEWAPTWSTTAPTGERTSGIHGLGNVNNSKWVNVNLVYPEVSSNYNRLQAEVSSTGSYFISPKYYNFRKTPSPLDETQNLTNMIGIKVEICAADSNGAIRVLVDPELDGTYECAGQLSKINTRQGFSWTRATWGLSSTSDKAEVHVIDNLNLESSSTDSFIQ